ncbi:MAG: 50S ribosomal protein L10 [Candidatus Nealsonbacteria bacterium]
MITKDKKKQIINDLTDKLSRQKAVVFFDYTGLKVNKFQELRSQFRKQGIECQAGRKTLIDLSLKKAGLSGLKVKGLAGQIALVFGYEDEVLPAKILYDFSKENEQVKILSGFVQGEYLENEAIMNLAQLPSRLELLGKVVGSILSPISNIINVFNGNLIKLINILKNLKLEA